jgi:hypothetical protein
VSTATIAAKYPEIHLLVCEGYSETILERSPPDNSTSLS